MPPHVEKNAGQSEKRLETLRKRLRTLQKERAQARREKNDTSELDTQIQTLEDEADAMELDDAPEPDAQAGSSEAPPSGSAEAASERGAGGSGGGSSGAAGTTGAGTTGAESSGGQPSGTSPPRSSQSPPNIPELANCDLGLVALQPLDKAKGTPIRSLKRGWGNYFLVLMDSGPNSWLSMAKPKDYPEIDIKSLPSVESDREKRKGKELLSIGLPVWDGVVTGDLKGMDPEQREKGDRYPFTLTTCNWQDDVTSFEVRGPLGPWESRMETRNVHKEIFERAKEAVRRAKGKGRATEEVSSM